MAPNRVRRVFDLSDQKTQRIAAIHKSRIEAMEAERLRRVDLVEQVRSLLLPLLCFLTVDCVCAAVPGE